MTLHWIKSNHAKEEEGGSSLLMGFLALCGCHSHGTNPGFPAILGAVQGEFHVSWDHSVEWAWAKPAACLVAAGRWFVISGQGWASMTCGSRTGVNSCLGQKTRTWIGEREDAECEGQSLNHPTPWKEEHLWKIPEPWPTASAYPIILYPQE